MFHSLFFFARKPNGDYRNSVTKDRSRSPSERVVVPTALGVQGNPLYSLPHHHLATLAGMDQPLALTKNSMVDTARGSAASLLTMPHTVSPMERQQVNGTCCFLPLTLNTFCSKWAETSTMVGPPQDVANPLCHSLLLVC